MSFSAEVKSKQPEFTSEAQDVSFEKETFTVFLKDGREVTVPLEWFPRLKNSSSSQRQNWRLIGSGTGIHWPDIDEDISVPQLLSK